MKSQVQKTARKRVFVGISGGVDSSVSAALLKKAGYDVTGVFIKVWQPDWLECTWKEERRDAMRVAAHLDIPFMTLDLEKEYKRDVVDYMLSEYKAGRTPNPDVMCNKAVKFGAFYDWSMSNGADFVATGHYAQNQILKIKYKNITNIPSSKSGAKNESRYSLLMGEDANKDQSYFLWNLRQDQLAHILFPIGHLEKSHVRKLAAQFKLPTAEKKDSQGICFIGMIDMKTFLSHYIKTTRGNVIDKNNNIIGTHPGAIFFTIGERHGFNVAKKSPNELPYYVVSKNLKDNTITVDMQLDDAKKSDVQHVELSSTNWISGAPTVGKQYMARTRYRQTLDLITFELIDTKNKQSTLVFKSSEQVIAPGQSLVVYDENICVGGGILEDIS